MRCVEFHNGSICIIDSDSIDARGDLNLNGVANEVADAVLYTNYFLRGISVFTITVAAQRAASDVNNDGRTLTVGDLVYMLRILTGDAQPIPKLSPYADQIDFTMKEAVVRPPCRSKARLKSAASICSSRLRAIRQPKLLEILLLPIWKSRRRLKAIKRTSSSTRIGRER